MSLPWALVLHAPYEGPGLVEEVGTAHGAAFVRVRVYSGEPLPAWQEISGLVSMGGPMSVNDAATLPVLEAEMGLMWVMVDQRMPVLGVCLGAQLLAAAHGGSVTSGAHPEYGCGQVQLTTQGLTDPVLGPVGTKLPVFHWHRDTFSLPRGAVRLAESSLYRNQAYRLSPTAYGFQFHVELTPELVEGFRPFLPPGVAITDAERDEIGGFGKSILERFFATALAPEPVRG